MYIQREEILKKIAERFATFSNVVTIQNREGYTDINKSSERLFIDILNLIYRIKLRDMNEIQNNYPAIDLGDYSSGICVQVTSESNNAKFRRTVKKFKEKKLNNQFSKLIFLIISNTKKCTLSDRDINTEVINLNDLVSKASNLNNNELNYLEEYFSRNLSSSIDERISILPTQTIPIVHQNEPTAFIKYLQIENEQQYIDELKYDLSVFAKTLISLSLHQKEFLFYILSQGQFPQNSYGYEQKHTVIISTTQIEQVFGSYGKDLFDSLKIKNLIYLNDEYDPHDDERYIRVMELYAMGKLDDVNLFSEFKGFCGDNHECLYQIILDCDFSVLS